MMAFCRKFWHCTRGVAAVEFGIIAPIMIILFAGLLEMGNYLASATAVEKGLRAGAMAAARSENEADPLTAGAELDRVQRITVFGVPGDPTSYCGGACPPRIPGWAEDDVLVKSRTETIDSGTGETTTIYIIETTVGYTPLIPGLLPIFSNFSITLWHEQAYIGI